MPKLLDTLITSLATILVRYHDLQKVNVRIQESDLQLNKQLSREYANDILKRLDCELELNSLITECTTDYKDRRDLLCVIKNEIVYLKSLEDRATPFTSEELEEYKKKIEHLFIGFQELLRKRKTETYDVEIRKISGELPTTIPLYGFLNTGAASYITPVCASGNIITDEVLKQFRLTAESKREEINIIAANLCMEHQLVLLTSQSQTLQKDLEETGEQLKSAEDQAKITEEQLKSAKEQARITEEQLKGAEELARITEEQLKSAEEQARITEEQLKSAKELARITEEQLKSAEEQARITEEQLKSAEEQARITEGQLKSAKEHTRCAPQATLISSSLALGQMIWNKMPPLAEPTTETEFLHGFQQPQ